VLERGIREMEASESLKIAKKFLEEYINLRETLGAISSQV
jgi:hypothetical protein